MILEKTCSLTPAFFEWGYNGTGPNFLAISLLAHFFGGDIPDNDSIDALKYNLISHLERFNKEDIIIDSDRILRALAYVPDSPVDLNSHPTLLSLYNEAQNRYKIRLNLTTFPTPKY